MRVARRLTLAVLFVVFSNHAFAQLEKPQDLPLIAKPNPALAGINVISVVFTAPDSEPNKDGLVWAKLKADVLAGLYEAGFKVSSLPDNHIVTMPELRINLGLLKIESCGQYVISVQTSLARGVALLDNEKFHIGADVWKVESGMQAVAKEKMPDEVTDIVQQQIKAFITACSVAGPGEKTSADTSASRKTEKNQAEAKFVASKNSEVFHKPDCRFAATISPQNLVSYNTRDEAIAAGKRPCSRCNP